MILLLLALISNGDLQACINEEDQGSVISDGSYLYRRREANIPWGYDFPSVKELSETVARLDSAYKATGQIKYMSDKGIALILLKQYDQAITLYRNIEKIAPNRYSTASNLGTAFELTGQNDSALKWISRAVEIDPESHMGSEWLHVNILKAKIGGEKYYNTRFLLNTDFGNKAHPTTTLNVMQLNALYDALYYQLNERVSFIKPKDKIVAQLLFDQANISSLIGNYWTAQAIYYKAEAYGYSGTLIKARENDSEQLANQHQSILDKMSPATILAIASVIFAFLVIMVIMAIIRARRWLKIQKQNRLSGNDATQ